MDLGNCGTYQGISRLNGPRFTATAHKDTETISPFFHVLMLRVSLVAVATLRVPAYQEYAAKLIKSND